MEYPQPRGLLPLLISLLLYIFVVPWALFLWLLNALVRLLVSFYLRVKYGKNICLVADGAEGLWALKRPNKFRVGTAGAKIDAPLTRQQVKQVFENILLPAVEIPGSENTIFKMKKILIVKCGYACWKTDESFDLDNHIRRYSDIKLYDKSDLKSMAIEWGQDMCEERPQWEVIIVPRYVENPGESETCLFCIRLNHAYMDGFCIAMFLKKYLTSGFTWFLDPEEFRVPFWRKLLFYTNAVIFGPYTVLLLILYKHKKFWPEIPLTDGSSPTNHFSWTESIHAEVIRKIRRKMDYPNLPTIFTNAYISAAKEILPDIRIPDKMRIAEVAALLPYPPDRFQNRFAMFFYDINPCLPDFERIKVTKNDSWNALISPWLPVTFFIFKSFGILPVWLHFITVENSCKSLIMNNFLSSKTRFRLLETANVLEILAFPQNPTDTGIQLLSLAYENSVKLIAYAESNWLSEKELEDVLERIPGIIMEWAQKLEDEVETVRI